MYFETFGQMKKMLGQLEKCIEMAAAYAETKKFDPNILLGVRLAPDQFAFARQVQIACDTSKLAASRLSGRDAPVHADAEATLDDLRARIRSVIGYLDEFSAADFDKAGTATITQARWEGKTMTGADYFLEHAVPNFYFHVTTAYALLRHNGVPVGKRDFLGPLTQTLPPS